MKRPEGGGWAGRSKERRRQNKRGRGTDTKEEIEHRSEGGTDEANRHGRKSDKRGMENINREIKS